MRRKMYDSAFRTMARKMPELFVPLLNAAFDRDYTFGLRPEQRNDRLRVAGRWLETDSIFEVSQDVYHVECQTKNPGNMALRMLEYGFHIGVEGARAERDGTWTVPLPRSCVLYLNSAPKRLMARVESPGEGSLPFEPRILCARDYDAARMFDEKMLLLYPFYLMRYERRLPSIARDGRKRASLISECEGLHEGLFEALGSDADAGLYNGLVGLTDEVLAHLFRNEAEFGAEVRAAMGGEILELLPEKIERLSREAKERGEAIGLEKGLKRGERKGQTDVLASLVAKGAISVEVAASELGVTPEEFKRITAA